MALPTTGPISLYDVNIELGVGGTTTISLNQTTVRNLFEKTGAGSAISMFDGRGKSSMVFPYINDISIIDNTNTVSTGHGYSQNTNSSTAFIDNSFYFSSGDAVNGQSSSYRGTGSLSVSAGGGNLSYQWQRSSNYYYRNSSAIDVYNLTNTHGDIFTGGTSATMTISNILNSAESSTTAWATPGLYRVKVSNALGTVYSSWIVVNLRYDAYTYQSGDLGQNCTPCDYDCNCNCYNEDNCCCYDSNNDGVSCCDVTEGCVDPPAQQCCCSAQWCGTSYNCYDCSTCTNYCNSDCPDNGTCRNCQYYTPLYTTDYSVSTPSYYG